MNQLLSRTPSVIWGEQTLKSNVWYQGEPERRCAREHGFDRSGISWFLEGVDIVDENTTDRVMRPSWLRRTHLRGFTIHWSATLLDTSGGQVGDPCRKPMLRNFLLKPDVIAEEDMVLVCFQYNCESLRAPDRLTASAKRSGEDVVCLQGTLFDGFGDRTKHGYHFFSLNRSGDACTTGCLGG